MQRYTRFFVVPALLLAAACGRDEAPRIDEALSRDLSLASQQAMPQQFVSPIEQQGYGPGYAQPQAYQAGYGQGAVAPRTASTATRRTSTARRSTSSGVYTGSTSSGRVVVEKNTKRDAIIGGVAGAAIGAVTSRDKVKGAVIGGAAGAILGGVIGNNVDITKRRVPYLP